MRLYLHKAFNPPNGKRNATLKGRARLCFEFDAGFANRQTRRFAIAELGQSGAHLRIKIDVRGAGFETVRIEGVAQQIQPSVYAATGGKAFEA